jgi:hypothetical protein
VFTGLATGESLLNLCSPARIGTSGQRPMNARCGDVLSMQNEIALAILGRSGRKLTPKERIWLRATRAVDRVAYQLYLQGVAYSIHGRCSRQE